MQLSPQGFALVIMLGAALLALWFVARFPKLGPSTLWVAGVQVVLAFVLGRAFVDAAPDVLRSLPIPNGLVMAIVFGTLPAATYLFVSMAWFIRSIQRLVSAFL